MLKSILMRLAPSTRYPQHTSLNKIVSLKENRTLITLSRIMINEYNTPEMYWTKETNTICYVSNQLFHTGYVRRHHMSCPMRSRLSHSFGCLDASATSIRNNNI